MDEKELNFYVGMIQDTARLKAKHLKSYIVYQNDDGELVREYYDGKIEVISDEEIKEYIKNS